MLDAWLDLFTGSRCSVCSRPGRALCRPCEAALPKRARVAWPSPTPPGLVRPAAVGDYADALRALVLDHKEHGRLALARPLGRLLALAVLDVWVDATGSTWPPVVDLVPVPSHPAVVRSRGHDPLLRIARAAAAALRAEGGLTRVRPMLRVMGRPSDQAGLDAVARSANLRGRFAVRAGSSGRPVVLVDDVVTTGATLREAQRALESRGVHPLGAATVAATRRRMPPGRDPGRAFRMPAPGH